MLESIRDIISKDIILSVDRKFEIKENENKGNNKSLKKVFIKDIDSKNIIAFKLDKKPLISNNYNSKNNKGINKGVDVVLISQDYILFIELKSTKIKETSIIAKAFSSISFLKGISYLLEYFYNTSLKDLKPGVIVIGLKRNYTRLSKPKPREVEGLRFENKKYENNKKSIQVLEIKKSRPSNYEISFNDIINKMRNMNKRFKNWP